MWDISIVIIKVGLSIFGIRLAQIYAPPLLTWLFESGLDHWQHYERRHAPPEPPLPRSPRRLSPIRNRRRSVCTDEEPKPPG